MKERATQCSCNNKIQLTPSVPTHPDRVYSPARHIHEHSTNNVSDNNPSWSVPGIRLDQASCKMAHWHRSTPLMPLVPRGIPRLVGFFRDMPSHSIRVANIRSELWCQFMKQISPCRLRGSNVPFQCRLDIFRFGFGCGLDGQSKIDTFVTRIVGVRRAAITDIQHFNYRMIL